MPSFRHVWAAFLLALLTGLHLYAQQPQQRYPTPFERSDSLNTATWEEAIAFYTSLQRGFPNRCLLQEIGPTDGGVPLHLVVISKLGVFTPERATKLGLRVLFINNAIHPGEPEGVDASMLLARNVLQKPDLLPDSVVLCIVPGFNVEGMRNRRPHTRANQCGPGVCGFRGNGQHLDLNRDFAKLDALNTRSLVQALRAWHPQVFIDTHTSNGADYQHALTLIETQPDKLGPVLGPLQRDTLTPFLYQFVTQRGIHMVPYVVTRLSDDPRTGLQAYNETERYSTGLASALGIPSFVAETHMLKPFPQRVRVTYDLLLGCVQLVHQHGKRTRQQQQQWLQYWAGQTAVPFSWEVDTTRADSVWFRGYEATTVPGPVTGLPLRHYDRSKPWQDSIPYWNYYTATDTAPVPEAWLVPQAWRSVVERLTVLGVRLERLPRDTTLRLEFDRLEDYRTVQSAYEGHYLHYALRTCPDTASVQLRKGDWLIPATDSLNLPLRRLLAELLCPRHPDSYFAWGFFDGVLMQKEGFSDYVFEPVLDSLLQRTPELRAELEAERARDTAFAASAARQLQWLYRRTDYYEPEHLRIPVFRLMGPAAPLVGVCRGSAAGLGREVHE